MSLTCRAASCPLGSLIKFLLLCHPHLGPAVTSLTPIAGRHDEVLRKYVRTIIFTLRSLHVIELKQRNQLIDAEFN
jgi:hypothetical protein